MITLVNTLLNVSRIELGTFSVEPKPIDLRQITDKIIEGLVPLMEKKQIAVNKRYDLDIPVIFLDPNLISIVVENLLSNAIQYTSESGKISIFIKNQPDTILLEVVDNGCGIPQSQQSRIFAKFFRADNARAKIAGGNGLGLYMSKTIVDRSGGKIWFESEEGKGTKFYVELPKGEWKERKERPD